MTQNNIPNDKSKYTFLNRSLACSNSKFEIFFDEILSQEELRTSDYIIVKPKKSYKDKVVGICILPFYNNKFCLMRGWRHQFDELVYQAPAGFIEENEEPSKTALRELFEETSLICKPENLVSLGSFMPDAGLIEGRVNLYLATECIKSKESVEFEVGMGELNYFTREELIKLLQQEKNVGGSTLITSFRAINYLYS